VDLAGPVWDDKKGGATGYGAALFAAWVSSFKK
jgi:leucyl aminopeptidase